MANRDGKTSLTIATGINATLSGATPAKGNIADLQGFESATFALLRGTVTDAGDANGIVIEIQESDTTADTAFTAVSDTNLIGLETALSILVDTSDNEPVGTIGYVGNKRYVRAVATGSTGTNAAIYGVWLLNNPSIAPLSSTDPNIAAT